MAIYRKDSGAVRTLVHWLKVTQAANVFPLEKLRKCAPWEALHVARCCEQACGFTDGEVVRIEQDTGAPYRWNYARKSPPPDGWLFLNPKGGNECWTYNETDKAVHRMAAVALEIWHAGIETETKGN